MDAAQAILEVQVLSSNCAASVLLTLNPDKEGFLGYWVKTALFCVSAWCGMCSLCFTADFLVFLSHA